MPQVVSSKKFSLKHLLRALKIVWQCSPMLAVCNVCLTVIVGLLPVVLLWVIGRLVDVTIVYISDGVSDDVVCWLLCFGAVLCTSAVASSLSSLASERLSVVLRMRVDQMLHTQMQRIGYQALLSPTFQTSSFRAITGSADRPVHIFFSALFLCQSTLTFLSICLWLMSVAWWLPISICLAGQPLFLSRLLRARLLYDLRISQAEEERRLYYYNNVLMGQQYAPEVRMFGLADYFCLRYNNLYSHLTAEKMGISKRIELQNIGASIVSAVLMAVIFFCVVRLVAVGGLSVGALAMYLMGIRRCDNTMHDVAIRLSTLHSNALYLTDFFAFIDVPHSKCTLAPFPSDFDSIRLENVSYAYPESCRNALADFSLTIRRGEVVAIKGQNGCGKSTIVKLICGLLSPQSGRVMIGNMFIADIDPTELQKHISIVFQDFRLFCVPAKDNIAFGNVSEPLSMSAVREAAKSADIDNLISLLPEGYDTRLGNQFKGSEMFSRGEWQRIAIARVLYSSADIILLDEPTSSLDPKARLMLHRSVEKLRKVGKTIIIVTHLDVTTEMADRVVTL